ncbi:alpha/beta hydrolase [Nocardia huaxiensis]|uniref:alpha/beta hydrolase n=1 Tax=Nocardia huaxiensis TaxID=2755382 RepID=UPI001E3EAF05|nr:alpha/beta hydrolase [Nocardia huaxiensis]UFS96888.1 alpha/beta hydrolase [Nocardia huaxiensis]
MRTLPPKVAEIDYRDEVLSVESVPGASPLTLAIDQGLRVVRPLEALLVWLQRVLPPGTDLPAVDFTDVAGVLLPPRRGTTVRTERLGPFAADWVIARRVDASAPVLLHFHGGGLRLGGRRTYRRVASNLSTLTGSRVFLPGFRLLPRTALPEMLTDALTAYRWLLDHGVPAERIVVSGDSGGAQLAAHAALAARDADLPVPAGLVLLSPWLDFDHSAKRLHHTFRVDPMVSWRLADLVDRWIAHGVLDPALGAVNADLTGLPPTLIQVSSTEVLRADAELMAARLADAKVPCHLQIWDRQMHVFQVLTELLPEARHAVSVITGFIDAVTSGEQQLAA